MAKSSKELSHKLPPNSEPHRFPAKYKILCLIIIIKLPLEIHNKDSTLPLSHNSSQLQDLEIITQAFSKERSTQRKGLVSWQVKLRIPDSTTEETGIQDQDVTRSNLLSNSEAKALSISAQAFKQENFSKMS